MSQERPILTAAAIRAAEEAAIAGGTSVELLMERAGEALAEAVYRFAGPMPVMVMQQARRSLCTSVWSLAGSIVVTDADVAR